MASDLTRVTFTHSDLAGNAMWYFGVCLPAAGTSNPQRCRCADMLTICPEAGGGGDGEEETCGCTDGKMEKVERGGGAWLFLPLKHIYWMLMVNIWALLVLKRTGYD